MDAVILQTNSACSGPIDTRMKAEARKIVVTVSIAWTHSTALNQAGHEERNSSAAAAPAGAIAYAPNRDGFEVKLYIVQEKVKHPFVEWLAQVLVNEAGDFIHVEPGVPHEGVNIGEGPLAPARLLSLLHTSDRATALQQRRGVGYPLHLPSHAHGVRLRE
jgi:uncharacterized RmlC-like cupin family protein